jgi:DNA helicase-2/ATP-dependent DNA helicase PcrA
MSTMKDDLPRVEPGSPEAAILEEEQNLLGKVQQQLAKDQLERAAEAEYDADLVSLRDQIADARLEDVAPLVSEMYRMQALGAANGKGRDLPVDVTCPYFGHLKLNDGKRTRDVLIGNRGFVKAGSPVNIVDWRNAPVSRIYYCYEEGDDYDEHFGGRPVQGVVEARRTVSIVEGELRRVTWSTGSLIRRGDAWLALTNERMPTLEGGAGVAVRPPQAHQPPVAFQPGRLGVVDDEGLREDKHLKEITALIDPKQFELITSPDSGTVILQGGAGSGKTTVALHRAAYLHFENPNIFAPKKMVVVVKSEPLTEYISRVLPSLDVAGTEVVTLESWMEKTRRRVLPELKQKRVDEVPGNVVRLKKHPAILAALERGVEQEAERIGEQLARQLPDTGGVKHAVLEKWSGLKRLALLPRIREMAKWVESGAAQRTGVTGKIRTALQGTLRRARSAGDDVLSRWADILTDAELLLEVARERGDSLDEGDVQDLVKWVSRQADEAQPASEDQDESSQKKGGKSGDEESEEDDRSRGIDGASLDEDGPQGRLDRQDDALLLRLTQLQYGGLPVAGSQKSVTYEHIVVDEAQDLSPTDIGVIRGALTKRESMTLAGDTAQKLIFDNGFDSWDTMLEDVGISGVKIDQLKVSYRSTKPVVEFARHVLGPLADPDPPQVPRDGAPVEQFEFGSSGEAVAFLGAQLRGLVLREKKANVAVVSRFRAQSDMYYEGLKKSEVPAVRRVYGRNFSFTPGIDVVDVAQIKGLEYDYVVLVDVNENVYPARKEARHLLHIAATRAVHQLWVISTGRPSPLLPPSM